jgi:hypothetical protein
MPEALPELVPLALLLFAFAFVWAARKLLAAMFGAVIDAVNAAHIPYLGGYIHDGLVAMEQAVDHAMGSLVSGIDSLMGASWHRFSQLNHWLWTEFKQHTLLGWITAQLVSELTHGFHALRNLTHANTHAHAHDAARIKRLEREYHGIEAKVKTLERDYAKGIGADVLPRIKTLEREAAHIQDAEIPAIRAADADAASAISNLYDWIKGKASIIGVGTFALAVTAVLDSLGLGNLRCPAFLRVLGRPNCGLGKGLESLLGWFVDLFIITDLCEVIPLLETAYEDVAAPAVGLLTEAIDAMPCVAGYHADALTVPRLHLPSNPGFALSLP